LYWEKNGAGAPIGGTPAGDGATLPITIPITLPSVGVTDTYRIRAAQYSAAGLEGFTFHDSRGTALTRMSRKLDVLELAKVSGLDRYLVSRRLPELVPVHVRRGKPRVCSVAGTPQTTWYTVR
jgi:hypothetical protein